MARSVWKGPYVPVYVLKLVRKARANPKFVIKIRCRSCTIIPAFVGLVFYVYSGKVFVPVLVTEYMIGLKFGEFVLTRNFKEHSGDRKAKMKK